MGCGVSLPQTISDDVGRSQSVHNFRSGLPAKDRLRCETVCNLVQDPATPIPHYDVLTSLVARMFDVPVVLITLLDGVFTHVASGVGVKPSDPKLRREQSFCAWSLLPLTPEVLIVPDALLDKRFCTLPRVKGPPNIRFYAGAPLVTSDGYRVGSLCLVDFSPRTIGGAGANMLCNFAEMIVRDMEARAPASPRKSLSVRPAPRASRLSGEFARVRKYEAVVIIDTSHDWKVLFANHEWEELFPQTRHGGRLWEYLDVLHGTKDSTLSFAECVKRRRPFTAYVELRASLSVPATKRTRMLTFKPANSQILEDAPGIRIQVPWLTDMNEDNPLYFAVFNNQRTGGDNDKVPLDVRQDWAIESLRVGSLLGRGSFGAVYSGWYRDLEVAIKVLPYGDSALKEIRIGKMCHHPNIVRTLDSAVASDQMCLVMELCDNGSLQRGIDAGMFRIGKTMATSRPDFGRLRSLLTDIAGALHYMHTHDMVHGDLSANNVLLMKTDVARITDFGLSFELHSSETLKGVVEYGTVTHMPAELLREGILGRFTDVYSLGVIMWELYMSQRPWAGLRQAQVIAAKLYKSQTLQFADNAPPRYERLCADCMAVDFTRRPSAFEVLQRLRDVF
jgi:hypothetical protein